MRNALVGKPASIGAVTLIALFAFVAGTVFFGHAEAAGTGSVKINVVVEGGTAKPTSFSVSIHKKDAPGLGSVKASGDTVVFQVEPGTYVLTRKGSSSYGTFWSGDCNAAGEVVITDGVQSNCTLTNKYGVKTIVPRGGSTFPTVPTIPSVPNIRVR